MIDREQLLSQKRQEVLKSLERWAKKQDLLAPGEQIEFSLNIKAGSLVVDSSRSSLLDRKLPEVFAKEYCLSLGISKHTIGILRRLFERGEINIAGWRNPQLVKAETVRDLIHIRRSQLEGAWHCGKTTLNAIHKVLESIGINWS